MKQKEDMSTIDMLGEKRGRGRPRLPVQRTEAKRKADQRARKREAGQPVPVTFELTPELIEALTKHVRGHNDTIGPLTKSEAVEKMLRNQVMRKR